MFTLKTGLNLAPFGSVRACVQNFQQLPAFRCLRFAIGRNRPADIAAVAHFQPGDATPRSQAPAWERTCLGSSASQRRHLSGALVPDPHRRSRASKTVALPSRSLVARKRAGAEWHSPTHFVTSSSSTPTEFHGQHRPRKSFGNAERTAMFRNCPMSAFLSLRPKIRRKFPFRPRVELPRPAPKRQPAQTGSASRDVGSERSPVFHKAGSKGASTISPKSFFTHSSRAAAIEAGQRPCAICQPRAQKT